MEPSLDLKDAYFHIPMAKRSLKYLCFVVHGKVYQFHMLLFGLDMVPLIFTCVLNEVMAYVYRKGIWLHIYLDHWLLQLLVVQQLQQDTNWT